MSQARILLAKDIMTRSVVYLRPDLDIYAAIKVLLRRRISGAPVLEGRSLVGILSERDCLQLLTADTYHHHAGGKVQHYMTTDVKTIHPDDDIYSIAGVFLSRPIRRLPVTRDGKLLGLVSRRDVLTGIEQAVRSAKSTSYPDYRKPA